MSNDLELQDRLALIERMIGEGRRQTQAQGWIFVMWGVAQLAAVAWCNLWPTHGSLPFLILMPLCGVIMAWRLSRRRQAETLQGRALRTLWTSFTISLFLILFLGFGRVFDGIGVVSAICVLMGLANSASGWFLRWRVQQGVGALWWMAAATLMLLHTEEAKIWIFLGMAVIGEVAFGIHLMLRERKELSGARVA